MLITQNTEKGNLCSDLRNLFFTFPHWPGLSPVRRHGICQIFFTSKIPIFSILPVKRVNRNIFDKIENVRCFTHLFRTNCQFCAIYTQIQTRSSYFMRTQA